MNDYIVMSNETAIALVTTGWRITKRHYEIILGTTLVIMAVAIAMSYIPYLRYLASVPMVLMSVGQMYIVREVIEGRPAKFSDMFRGFKDDRWMQALLPLGISGVAIALIQVGLNKILENGFFAGFFDAILKILLTLIWVALTAFSGPLIVFKNKTFQESVDLNLRATTANWQALLVLTIYLLGILVLCAVLFLLPLFFIALPIMYVTGYLTYACMFEGLDIIGLRDRYNT